jgi:glycosyltransferase involved in cell wall biosynthesis
MSETLIINGRFLTQKLTGVHRYAFEMCSALQNLGCDFIILAPNNILSDYKHTFNVLKIGKFSSHLWEQIELPIYINKHYKNSILINFTGLGSIFKRRSICTIHDLSYLENPAWFTKSYYYLYKFLTPIAAKKALKIITVSEFSKREIISKLNIHESKVVVISNAVSEKLINKKDEISDTSKYLLSVSSIDPRKNQIRLIEAFNLLPYKDLKLYIVGKKNKVFGKHSIIDETNPNIIFTGYLTDNELFDYYKNATAFIYPSLYEGFGIPNLEAMINKCPVITSEIPPHIEVCQEAALYFDPYNPKDIADKINIIIENKEIRKNLIKKGELRVSQFSWHKSAEKLLEVLNNISRLQ